MLNTLISMFCHIKQKAVFWELSSFLLPTKSVNKMENTTTKNDFSIAAEKGSCSNSRL